MRFMIIVKGELPDGVMPTEAEMAEMGRFNEEMAKAGVLLSGEGLAPSKAGARVLLDGDRRTVVPGPFPEKDELVAGFWLIQTESLEDAIDWARRCPNLTPSGERGVLEIRRIFEDDDFGDEFTPELREQEASIRERAATNAGG